MKKFDEFKINESSIDYDVLDKMTKLPCFNELKEEFRRSIDKFIGCIESADIGFDEGDTDHTMALDAVIQDALNEVNG